MKIATRLLLLSSVFASCAAYAGTLTVTQPNNDDFLGRTNKLKFQLTGSIVRSTVFVTVTNNNDPNVRFSFQKDFTPDNLQKVDGDIDLNFNDATPEGRYTILVHVVEPGNPYNDENRSVSIDVKSPEYVEVQPLNNSFVKGIVTIRVRLREPNIKEWRVQINNQDIPNNSGTTESFEVLWDTTNIELDGSKTINISAKDLAGNEATKAITVSLDRIAPSITILAPTVGTTIRPRSNISVAIEINDQSGGSVDVSGIDVVILSNDSQRRFITRGSRRASRVNGTTLQWVGRVRWTTRLPESFILRVTAVDRAGNQAEPQEVTLSVGRGR